MQIEILAGLSGLLLLGAVVLRGGTALAAFAYYRLRSEREDRRIFQALRARSSVPNGKVDSARTRHAPNLAIQPRSAHDADEDADQDKIKLVVAKRVVENAKGDICSFYLIPTDRQSLLIFSPGQFLTFSCNLPGMQAPITRCYSLSMHPTNPQEFYRVSVKRLMPGFGANNHQPPGLLSNVLHDQLREGAIIEAAPPAGSFCLDRSSNRPLVLIAGGIGITPLLSMLDWLAVAQSQREVWVFYGVRNSYEHAFRDHFRLIRETLPGVNQVVFYSQPTTDCQRGVDYDEVGHVNVDYMQHVLKARDYEFYVCGPTLMMQSITHDLLQWGVPEDAIMSEDFGAEVHSPSVITTVPPPMSHATVKRINIEFSRSKKKAVWTGRQGSLLELAEACGIKARHACRAGQCGTCKIGLRSGQVEYVAQPASNLENGTCLPCVSRPTTDLVLDL